MNCQSMYDVPSVNDDTKMIDFFIENSPVFFEDIAEKFGTDKAKCFTQKYRKSGHIVNETYGVWGLAK